MKCILLRHSKWQGLYLFPLHWDKFQLLQVRRLTDLRKLDGQKIEASDFMTYLGSTIDADGGIKTELGRRIGTAWGEFSKLDRLWRHTSLTISRKV